MELSMPLSKFKDKKVGSYVYWIDTAFIAPEICRCTIESIHDTGKKGVIHYEMSGHGIGDMVFSVNTEDSFSIDLFGAHSGLLFSSSAVFVEYAKQLSRVSSLMKEGWLHKSMNAPEQFERVVCIPESKTYQEQGYYLNGHYIRDGYKSRLDKKIDYWRPM